MNCIPFLQYDDAPAAIDWLEKAYDFERTVVYDGPDGKIAHAQLRFGDGAIMLASAANDWGMRTPKELGGVNQGIYVAVEDADRHYERARGAGAEIVREPFDTEYDSREYIARDPEGNLWSFGTYRPE